MRAAIKILKFEKIVIHGFRTNKEKRGLVEAGFEYVCEIEGVQLFRKRK